MDLASSEYDPRYLAGIMFFNRHDFFEAHEVWEDLWGACPGTNHRFYQGLIQAAVALHHFCNGNVRGAVRLFHSARNYMKPYGSPYLGLNVEGFWQQMEHCFAEPLAAADLNRAMYPDEEQMPVLTLDPPPTVWPDPEEFV